MRKNEIIISLFHQLELVTKQCKHFQQSILDQLSIDLTVEQWNMLSILAAQQPLSQNQLARLTCRDAASITRTVDLLEAKNLLKRSPDPESRRRYLLNLTANGAHLTKKHKKAVENKLAGALQHLNINTLNEFSTLLTKVNATMQ